MSKIDVGQWKEFKLSSMFDICYGSFVPKKDRGTKTPFITTSSENNGISYYVDSDPMFRGDALTVASDGSVGETFYHDEPFSAGNIAVVLEPHDDVRAKWTPKSALFIATCIRKYAQIRHSWTDKYSVNRVRDTMLPLPVTSSGQPDWQYMDSYIAKRAALAHKYVSELAKAKDKPKPLKINGWKEFKVGDLLTKIETKKVPFKALDLPVNPTDNYDLPLVAAGVDNQGRGRYVDSKYATVLHGCLTVSANGANSGATFYQDSDFSILQDAYALELVDKYKSMGMDNIYLFLAAVIRRGLINNDWSNKATWTRVQKTSIKLPVISTGEPDWHYMDSYIAKRAALAHKYADELKSTKNQRGSR